MRIKMRILPKNKNGLLINLVIRRRSRKLGDPRRRGIDGDLDERLKSEYQIQKFFHSENPKN